MCLKLIFVCVILQSSEIYPSLSRFYKIVSCSELFEIKTFLPLMQEASTKKRQINAVQLTTLKTSATAKTYLFD